MGAGADGSKSEELQTGFVGTEPEPWSELLPKTSSSEFQPALAAYEYPLIVWESATTSIVLANQRAAALIGLPLQELIGRQIYDFFLPRDAVESVVRGIESGTLVRLQARRVVVREGQEQILVWVWVRAIEIDDRRGGVALVVPSAGGRRLEPRSGRPGVTCVRLPSGWLMRTGASPQSVQTSVRCSVSPQRPASEPHCWTSSIQTTLLLWPRLAVGPKEQRCR